MKKNLYKILAMIGVFVFTFSLNLNVLANESITDESLIITNEEMQDTTITVHRVSYTIYDENGNVVETGNLPIDENEIKARDYWGSRTINHGEYMTLYSQDTGYPYFLVAGSQVNMQFGLNRNALIASGIKRDTGEYLANYRGITGGRSHSVIIQETGIYYGYIRNDDASAVTVNYASFSTND